MKVSVNCRFERAGYPHYFSCERKSGKKDAFEILSEQLAAQGVGHLTGEIIFQTASGHVDVCQRCEYKGNLAVNKGRKWLVQKENKELSNWLASLCRNNLSKNTMGGKLIFLSDGS